MMKRLNRKKLKQGIRLAIAIHAYDAMNGLMLESVNGITESDLEFMSNEAKKIAWKLAGENPLNFGTVDECVNYFLNKK